MIRRPRPTPPPAAFTWEAVARLPLAEAVLSVWNYALQAEFLEEVFDRHRGRSCTDVLTFPTIGERRADALLRQRGSGRASFRRAAAQGRLPTPPEAVYGKRRRLPVPLSLGFVEAVPARLLTLVPPGAQATRWPAGFAGYTVVIADGKTIQRVAPRLLPTRGTAGQISGGQRLVA